MHLKHYRIKNIFIYKGEEMKIGIIDADLIGRDSHRFPNLACEKISGYWKEQGAEVILLTDYSEVERSMKGGVR